MERWFHTTRVPLKSAFRRDRMGQCVMDIVLNGAPMRFPDGSTIAALLAETGLGERRVAVEVNGTIVPRGQHPTHELRDADRVEIVHALGGG